MIHIQNYEIDFKPFSYRLSIEGKFEISSKHQINPKMLIGKLSFPNQEITSIELTPDDREKCYARNDYLRCKVFKSQAFLNLSSDKYFAREFAEQERIPFQMSFSFNQNNSSAFKISNSITREEQFIEFIRNLNLLKIEDELKYKNSFNLTRNKYESEYKTLELPIQWKIKNGTQTEKIKKISVKIPRYDDLRDRDIKQIFALSNSEEITIHQIQHSVNIEGRDVLEKRNLNIRNFNDWKSYFWTNDSKNHSSVGIFFPTKTSGKLKSQFRLITNHHGFAISIENHFSFYENLISNSIKIKIIQKYDDYFRNLSDYKFVNL